MDFPLRSTHEKADEAGIKLGDAVLRAMEESEPIESTSFRVKSGQVMLPSALLPGLKEWEEMRANHLSADPEQINEWDHMEEWLPGVSTTSMRLKQLNALRKRLDSGQEPPPRRFDVYPGSKLKTVEYFKRNLNIDVSVYSIYRFLDELHSRLKEKIEKITFEHTKKILKGKIGMVFYDIPHCILRHLKRRIFV